MFSLFGKKEETQAMAEVLEDGLAIMNQEMHRLRARWGNVPSGKGEGL